MYSFALCTYYVDSRIIIIVISLRLILNAERMMILKWKVYDRIYTN